VTGSEQSGNSGGPDLAELFVNNFPVYEAADHIGNAIPMCWSFNLLYVNINVDMNIHLLKVA